MLELLGKFKIELMVVSLLLSIFAYVSLLKSDVKAYEDKEVKMKEVVTYSDLENEKFRKENIRILREKIEEPLPLDMSVGKHKVRLGQ